MNPVIRTLGRLLPALTLLYMLACSSETVNYYTDVCGCVDGNNDMIYISNKSTIYAYDVSDRRNPVRLGSVYNRNVCGLGVRDSELYALFDSGDGEFGWFSYLGVFDVSNPSDIRVMAKEWIGPHLPDDQFFGIHFRGNSTYLNLESTVEEIDVTYPDLPMKNGAVWQKNCRVDIAGSYMYGVSNTMLLVINLDNALDNASMTAVYDDARTHGCRVWADVENDTLCVSKDDAIYLLDVSCPLNPTLSAEIEGTGGSMARINGGYAYCMTDTGFNVIDVNAGAVIRQWGSVFRFTKYIDYHDGCVFLFSLGREYCEAENRYPHCYIVDVSDPLDPRLQCIIRIPR